MKFFIEANQFLRLRYRYEQIGVPDPTLTAFNEIIYPQHRVALPQDVRQQLESLVAYWRTCAKPGRVRLALEARHYVKSLHHWRPTGATQ